MKFPFLSSILLTFSLLIACSNNKIEDKGFPVNDEYISESNDDQNDGIKCDTLKFETQPNSVMLTGLKNVRLTTLYKVNYSKNGKDKFIGSNNFHFRYEDEDYISTITGNNWNNHLYPGLEAIYGYNLVNISHFNLNDGKIKNFFEKPALIKTLYYPTFAKDTLNFKSVSRDYFIVSVYDQDTNKDGYLNLKDSRRIYLFDSIGNKQQPLIPIQYSVYKSGYDQENDWMFLFAQHDSNNNGKIDSDEPIHIFYVDLKNPLKTGRVY